MFTENFYKMLEAVGDQTGNTSSVHDIEGVYFKSVTGSNIIFTSEATLTGYTNFLYSMRHSINGISSTNDHGYIWCGSGGTAPQITDYTLESPFTGEQISLTPPEKVQTVYINGKPKFISTFNVTAISAVTVREIGVFCRAYSHTSSKNGTYMVVREVLDEPVTLAAGEFAQISLVLDFTTL